MKYIKTLEAYQPFSKYNTGDYVLLNPEIDEISNYILRGEYNIYKNWGHIMPGGSNGQVNGKFTYMYNIDYIDSLSFETKNIKSTYILEPDILRELTDEEIDEYLLMSNINKYNL